MIKGIKDKIKSKQNRAMAGILAAAVLLTACTRAAKRDGSEGLDPKNPIVITIWCYYNGAIMTAFNAMITEFNETIGAEQGIIVEGNGMGNVTELEQAVIASVNKEVGSLEMPNIFASYADTAYKAEKLGLLADISEYLTEEERDEYIESYLEEGKIGLEGELRIFPIAKSTEILMINETDWQPFAEANSLSYEELKTISGVAAVSELYYDWTDAQTPDIAEDGKAFFGRDSMANMFIVASREYGTEIFNVSNGKGEIEINREVMKKIWDYYYVPYISGYYYAYGKFRSEDARVGDILAYVGSTSSAAYFPGEVTANGEVRPVTAKVLPVPSFEGGEKIMVQQGAGMVITKGAPEEEYASAVFLKWFTDTEQNIKFSALSGYMPVKKGANDFEKIISVMGEHEIPLDELTEQTLELALDEMKDSRMYTNRAFDGGFEARTILEGHLQEKAFADREEVIMLIEQGMTHREAVARYNTEDEFNIWLESLTAELEAAAGKR